MRVLLIVFLFAGAAFSAGCQSSSPGSIIEERSVYGQPCNQHIRDAGLCRTVYSNPG